MSIDLTLNNLCQAIRQTQGRGVMPDGSSRFTTQDGREIYHYMGCSTFSNYTVLLEIAVAKIHKDAPLDKVCYIGCGVTGIGAVVKTVNVEAGSSVVVFGLGGIGLNVIQGAKLVGAGQIVGVDINNDKKELAEKYGMTDFVNPNEIDEDLVQHLIRLIGGGADSDYSFECIGNTKVMRQALECAHKGWGVSVIIGVAGTGEEISTRPFSACDREGTYMERFSIRWYAWQDRYADDC